MVSVRIVCYMRGADRGKGRGNLMVSCASNRFRTRSE